MLPPDVAFLAKMHKTPLKSKRGKEARWERERERNGREGRGMKEGKSDGEGNKDGGGKKRKKKKMREGQRKGKKVSNEHPSPNPRFTTGIHTNQ